MQCDRDRLTLQEKISWFRRGLCMYCVGAGHVLPQTPTPGQCIDFMWIQRPKNFPPGSQPVPLFGNLFQLNITNPLKDFEKIYDTLPMLRSLPLPFKNTFKNYYTIEKMFANMISKHKISSIPGEPRDFLDCYLDEFDKGTIIMPNLASVLSEAGQWKFPHEFNPANFLNEQGQFEKPEAFLPFSTGPHMCLGEGLARMELFHILVTLLNRFQFFWPEDAGEPDFTPVFGITLTPKPYRMGVRLRQPARET
ncbi:hypothetical protein SRHO_G00118550 [Serrasalmus rhombeus]